MALTKGSASSTGKICYWISSPGSDMPHSTYDPQSRVSPGSALVFFCECRRHISVPRLDSLISSIRHVRVCCPEESPYGDVFAAL